MRRPRRLLRLRRLRRLPALPADGRVGQNGGAGGRQPKKRGTATASAPSYLSRPRSLLFLGSVFLVVRQRPRPPRVRSLRGVRHGQVRRRSRVAVVSNLYPGTVANMNSKKCAKCEKTVYPTEELKCLEKVRIEPVPNVSGITRRNEMPDDVS